MTTKTDELTSTKERLRVMTASNEEWRKDARNLKDALKLAKTRLTKLLPYLEFQTVQKRMTEDCIAALDVALENANGEPDPATPSEAHHA